MKNLPQKKKKNESGHYTPSLRVDRINVEQNKQGNKMIALFEDCKIFR